MQPGKPRKKKRRRKKHFFLNLILVILLSAGVIGFLNTSFFDIQQIKVSGNSYYTSEQVLDLAKAKTGGNLFRTKLSSWKDRLLQDPYIKTVKISRRLPDTVKIAVKERAEYAAIPYSGSYVIIDRDALVLRQSEVAPAVPILIGFTLSNIEPGTALKVEENGMLTKTMKLLKYTEKNEVYFKKIEVSPVTVRAYIYDSLVCEGTPANMMENMDGLREVIYDLYTKGIERGTITIGADDYFSFSPDIE